MTIPRPRQTIIYTMSEETVLIPWQGGPAQLLNELLWNTSRVILRLASCQVAICYAYFTATYIDFTLSYGFLYSIHARFKTIYIDLMLFYSFFPSCYAYFTVTNVDFTLSCGFLSSIHACFKTIYIDVMLFYSFSSRCYACSRMIYLLTSYCFMASGQVSIILMVPVHVERPCQAAKAHVQKVSNVSKKTPTAK